MRDTLDWVAEETDTKHRIPMMTRTMPTSLVWRRKKCWAVVSNAPEPTLVSVGDVV